MRKIKRDEYAEEAGIARAMTMMMMMMTIHDKTTMISLRTLTVEAS